MQEQAQTVATVSPVRSLGLDGLSSRGLARRLRPWTEPPQAPTIQVSRGELNHVFLKRPNLGAMVVDRTPRGVRKGDHLAEESSSSSGGSSVHGWTHRHGYGARACGGRLAGLSRRRLRRLFGHDLLRGDVECT